MAVTGLQGFEDEPPGILSQAGTGVAAFSSSVVRTGARSVHCTVASGDIAAFTIPEGTSGFIHFGLRIVSLPSGGERTFTPGSGVNYRLNTTGTISVFDGSTLVGTSSTALSVDRWYWLGMRLNAGTSVALLQIDGTTEVSGTVTDAGIANSYGFDSGQASSCEAYFDDVIVDDTGFLASSKVDMAFPISDNTRIGTTAGAGGTTNLWEAINNVPYAGVASASETNTTNIEFPASTTCDYIANLETYSTLGIVTGDTVLAVQAVVRHGEDIATGTKNLQNVGALTNPTVGGTSVIAGANGGAHGAEAGFWVTEFGAITTSPSVTLGTSPTIRTTRTSESRVACIDFMGMKVAWTPAAFPQVPHISPYPQLLAH